MLLSIIYHLCLMLVGFVLTMATTVLQIACAELVKKSVDCWFDSHFKH